MKLRTQALRLTILLIVAFILLRIYEWRSLYVPSRRMMDSPSDYGMVFEEACIRTSDGKNLYGWWFPREGARVSIIVMHGNAGNISGRIWMAGNLLDLGANVLLFDYRGYGRSKGFPTEKGTYRDALAAYDWVREKTAASTDHKIVVYGRSLGGAIAIYAATERPVDGLIVESTFTSVPDMASHIYPFLPLRYMCAYRYASIARAPALRMPKLVAHSRTDEMIPFEMGQQLFEAMPEPKTFIEITGDHNNSGWPATPAYWDAISAFIDHI